MLVSTVVEVHGIRHLSMGADDHGNCGVAASTGDLKDLGFVFPQEKRQFYNSIKIYLSCMVPWY